jgi:hypothetical protein
MTTIDLIRESTHKTTKANVFTRLAYAAAEFGASKQALQFLQKSARSTNAIIGAGSKDSPFQTIAGRFVRYGATAFVRLLLIGDAVCRAFAKSNGIDRWSVYP